MWKYIQEAKRDLTPPPVCRPALCSLLTWLCAPGCQCQRLILVVAAIEISGVKPGLVVKRQSLMSTD